MLDGLAKKYIDPIWERMAAPLVRAGLSPNQVTLIGLGLILLVSAAYLLHESALVFGLTLAFAFAFDALDGAVARQRGMSTKFGGYLDAMVDRYQELVVLAAIAWVNDLWALSLFAFSGAIITSYAKARTAIEITIDNTAWPDLFERLERIIYLCAMLVVSALFSTGWILIIGLAIYALLCHLTAIQRMMRAANMLKTGDSDS